MVRFGVVVALFFAATANAQIVLSPSRPLTPHLGTGPVPAYASRPFAASSGDQFLVVWNDTRVVSYGSVQATRVSADGAVLDPTGIRFPVDAGSVLGVGSSGQDYLVVTARWFFIVSRDGEVTRGDPWFAEDSPNYVVSNGTDYVVTSTYGYFSFHVDRKGHLLTNAARPVRIAVGRNYVAIDRQSRVSVIAPDGTISEFTASIDGVVTAVAAGDDEIALLVRNKTDRIVRFRLNGTYIGEDRTVVLPVPLDQEEVTMGWNGTGYVVLYTGASCFLGVDRGDGVVVPQALPFDTTAGAIASSAHGALAVWADARFATSHEYPRRQIAAVPLPPGADPASMRDVIVSLSEHAQISPRIETIGGRQLIAFVEQSGSGDEIVVVPAGGGDEMLRIRGEGARPIHALRAATDGNTLFLLWSEDDTPYTAVFRAALVTATLQATLLDIGNGTTWDEPNVSWSGTDYFVYGPDLGRRFSRDGVVSPAPLPFEFTRLGVAPAAAIATDGRTYVVDATLRFPPFDAASNWYEINLHSWFNDELLVNNDERTAPSIAASGRDATIATQHGAQTIFWGVLWRGIDTTPASSLAPHVVGRDGAFLVTIAERIAWVKAANGAVSSATLPESVLESIAPSTGPLTIAYVTSGVDARANGTARIWLRDVLPEHHRAVGH